MEAKSGDTITIDVVNQGEQMDGQDSRLGTVIKLSSFCNITSDTNDNVQVSVFYLNEEGEMITNDNFMALDGSTRTIKTNEFWVGPHYGTLGTAHLTIEGFGQLYVTYVDN